MHVRVGMLMCASVALALGACRGVRESGYCVRKPCDDGVWVKPEPAPSAKKPIADGRVRVMSSFGAIEKAAACPDTDPACGMHKLWSNLKWSEGELSDHRKFRWATIYGHHEGRGTQQLTLIVGANDQDNATGLKPPLLDMETSVDGWDIEHCKGGPGVNEVVTLHRGFMCVHVEGADEALPDRFPIWPAIIKTKSIPAGAYATTYVLLTINRQDGTSREFVFRPNQAAFESGADCSTAPDKDTGSMVSAHPDREIQYDTTQTGCLVRPDADPRWRDLTWREGDFLTKACSFYKDALQKIANATGTPIEWRPCGEAPVQGRGKP